MKRTILLFALLLGLGLAAPAWADQLFVQQSCPSTPCSPAGLDPNPITNPSSFVVGVAGNATGEDPLLVIVGVYDGQGKAAPTLNFGSTIEQLAGLGTYHLSADPVDSTSDDEYSALGLTSQTNSETFAQWNTWDQNHLGLAPATDFELFAFALNGEELNGFITLGEKGAPKGSFIIAYDCKDDTGDCSLNGNHGNIMDTPFTNAGVISRDVKPTPEPASLFLFGSGLLGLSFKLRRRFCR